MKQEKYISGNLNDKITKEEHIKRHTLKEDTHDFSCPYCEGLKV